MLGIGANPPFNTDVGAVLVFLVAQVLYLDSMDMGLMNQADWYVPRVQFFNSERIRMMVEADTTSPRDGRAEGEFGASKVCKGAQCTLRVQCCYA